MALQGGKVCVCAETYQNSLNGGVQSLGRGLIPSIMEGQVTEIRPEPKPVKWVKDKTTQIGENDR